MIDDNLGLGAGLMYMPAGYWVIFLITTVLSLAAQAWIKSSFGKWSRVPNTRGMSGGEAAEYMLRSEGITDVAVRRFAGGMLSDHFDPRSKVINLSPEVYDGRSVASVGVACHEAGHALQHARHYAPLALRSLLVGPTQIGSKLAIPMIILGLALQMFGLAKIGVILFGVVFLFQLVTLPVEIDASRRSRQALVSHGIVAPGTETRGVTSVLTAAAFTYIAAAIATLLTLLYYVSLLAGNRSRN